MLRILLALIIFNLALTIQAEENKNAAKYADYLLLGYIRSYKSSITNDIPYLCPSGKTPQTSPWCLAGKGKDKLGKEKLSGWTFIDIPGTSFVSYYDPELYKVKANGEYGRYINMVNVVHSYRKPKAGTSGYSYSSGSSKTVCNDYRTFDTNYGFSMFGNSNFSFDSYGSGSSISRISGSGKANSKIRGSINCETEPAQIINVPGTTATEGYVNVYRLDWILDCKLNKVASFKNLNKQSIQQNWKPIEESSSYTVKTFAPQFCRVIDALKPLLFSELM